MNLILFLSCVFSLTFAVNCTKTYQTPKDGQIRVATRVQDGRCYTRQESYEVNANFEGWLALEGWQEVDCVSGAVKPKPLDDLDMK